MLIKAEIFEEYVWSDKIRRLSCVRAETRWTNYKALMIYERMKARRHLKKLHQAITVPLNHQRQPISRQLLENQDKRINFVVIHAPAAEPESCSAGKWTKLYFSESFMKFLLEMFLPFIGQKNWGTLCRLLKAVVFVRRNHFQYLLDLDHRYR